MSTITDGPREGSGLGRLEAVDPREVWPLEAKTFTPWLLGNAERLGEVLGMDLELSSAEFPVGNFSLDLVGIDRSTGERVIVENQLTPSDHGHLGQLLTYAGGTDAVNVVWVTIRFREEHRAALDWLNSRTDESTRFFGVEVGVVRIGDSLPAPLLRVVVQPNDWGKTVRTKAQGEGISARGRLYEQFWTLFLDQLRTRRVPWTATRKGTRQNGLTMPSGTSGLVFSCSFGRGTLCSDICFQDPDPAVNDSRFSVASARRESIETTYGGELQFEPLAGSKGCRIATYRSGRVAQTEQWDNYIEWFISTQQRLRTALDHVIGAGPVPERPM